MLINLFAMILIIFGITSLAYNGFTYTSREKVAEIGSLELSADTEKTVYLSPVAGGVALAVGLILIIINRKGRKP
ncbi:MAG: DUF3185 domain-containing protein [Gammaproteobacteria bacterium]|nr:DUF3185 domain-containing protein [Gammaproteobacteria bacterium]